MTMRTWLLVAGSFMVFGCGQPQTNGYNYNTGVSTAVGAGKSGGGAGGTSAGGTAAPSGAAGMASVVPQGPVACGTTMCQPATANPMVQMPPLPPCCADAATATCGWSMAGTCTKPPPVDMECPSLPSGQKGCCLAGNKCGIDASRYGAGCFDLTGTPFAMGITPTDCDGKPIATGAGGGGGAAGANAGGSSAAGMSGSAGGGAAGKAGGSATGSGGMSGGSAGRPATSGGTGGR